jgi:hypothetical protein
VIEFETLIRSYQIPYILGNTDTCSLRGERSSHATQASSGQPFEPVVCDPLDNSNLKIQNHLDALKEFVDKRFLSFAACVGISQYHKYAVFF